jgi:hypothetical protein
MLSMFTNLTQATPRSIDLSSDIRAGLSAHPFSPAPAVCQALFRSPVITWTDSWEIMISVVHFLLEFTDNKLSRVFHNGDILLEYDNYR